MPESVYVEAGGGIVWRCSGSGTEVLLVHRPLYDDWSFPKGKRSKKDPSIAACAVREVLEETGMSVRLGAFVANSTYPVIAKNEASVTKRVHYWLMEAIEGEFQPNREVDTVAWVSLAAAALLLTYEHDRSILSQAGEALAHHLGR